MTDEDAYMVDGLCADGRSLEFVLEARWRANRGGWVCRGWRGGLVFCEVDRGKRRSWESDDDDNRANGGVGFGLVVFWVLGKEQEIKIVAGVRPSPWLDGMAWGSKRIHTCICIRR